ncbi:hypothetical protein ACFVAF_20165 [Streptomyces sp. NPDC057596]|uniref:hypothetical protein n=1 Tax=Streptomyces sp. NPDC057596 TaxID=3346178 RepID=UPI0036AD5066
MAPLLIMVGIATVVPGVAALVFGWLPSWLSGHVEHPRIWGVGMLGFGLFVVTQISSLRAHVEDLGWAAVALRYGVLVVGLVALVLSGTRLIRR